ncbi:MAG TPA: chromosome partition protein MukB, partial [Labilithrix sp.]|nr:chromosome partition protein MukB [Labilithrix sp.]
MSRACATALALVNWKGVFYERYLLDRHVTALEGANGAGKTTVMIAAYVVLLPDLARLRFTNLGETAATGGDRGLYGRLGQPGRPSYAAMEIALGDGSSVIAGVELVRKSEPTIELTPFLVSGLALDGRLKEILLVSGPEHDAVPDLAEIRTSVTRLGGKLDVFGSAKDYFGALFELGITPLRLATEEERTKLHDMLRTSMTGGISRALTSELRSFLLKEESGLADTLVRMRANLEACRRTRTEVAEARALEHEITAIHAAGSAMFAASVAATETAATEASLKKKDADERIRVAESYADELKRELETTRDELERCSERAKERERAIEERKKRRSGAVTARAIADRLATAEQELAQASVETARARELRARATQLRDECVLDRDRAREAYERAARGLGDLQAGLDELHSRAHAQRTARARLADARQWLGDPSLSAADLDAALARLRAELGEVDARRARLERESALADVRANDYRTALAALLEIRGAPVPDDATHYDVARSELARLEALAHVASRREALGKELATAKEHADFARKVHAHAAALGITLAGDPAAAVSQALARADAVVRSGEDDLRTLHTTVAETQSRADEARAEAEALETSIPQWEAIAPALARLDVRTAEDVARKRALLTEERDRARSAIAVAEANREACLRQAELLDTAGGLPTDLLAMRDVLAADLLASRFESSRADEASALEAALGPLAHALVVADPGGAADALAQEANAPETVWLVAEDDVPRIIEAARAQVGSAETIDVVVKETHALRVTRRPSRPILGRDARARRAAELRAEAEATTTAIDEALEDARRCDA